MQVVYFSNPRSNNTHRFVEKLGVTAVRIPWEKTVELRVTEPYVLITPTYGAGRDAGSVPQPVIRFLNNAHNRSLIQAVVGTGNTNFGASYCKAADTIALKCGVPVLHRLEVFGLPSDVSIVQQLLQEVNHDSARLFV